MVDKIMNPNFNSEVFWQHIIALDVQFNSQRYFCNYLSEFSHLLLFNVLWFINIVFFLFIEILYIKRRNQLFRDLSKSKLNSFRKQYFKLRHNILLKKYGSSNEQLVVF